MWPFKSKPDLPIGDHVASLLRVMSDPNGWKKSYTNSDRLCFEQKNVSVYPWGKYEGQRYPEVRIYLPERRDFSNPRLNRTESKLVRDAARELSRKLTDIAVLRQQETDRLALEKLKSMEPEAIQSAKGEAET